MKIKKDVTAKQVRETFKYDPKTGFITRLKARCQKHIGARAEVKMNTGYYRVNVTKKQSLLAHRLAWLHFYGRYPRHHLDHINGIKTDNRIVNLRDVSMSQNIQNSKIRTNNSSGVKGLHFYKRTGGWQAYVAVKGKRTARYFTDRGAAINYLRNLRDKLHGGFGNHG